MDDNLNKIISINDIILIMSLHDHLQYLVTQIKQELFHKSKLLSVLILLGQKV